jgi:hypothetical protein
VEEGHFHQHRLTSARVIVSDASALLRLLAVLGVNAEATPVTATDPVMLRESRRSGSGMCQEWVRNVLGVGQAPAMLHVSGMCQKRVMNVPEVSQGCVGNVSEMGQALAMLRVSGMCQKWVMNVSGVSQKSVRSGSAPAMLHLSGGGQLPAVHCSLLARRRPTDANTQVRTLRDY